jgi:phage/plasmid primase-like uncharacterized protein
MAILQFGQCPVCGGKDKMMMEQQQQWGNGDAQMGMGIEAENNNYY